MARETAGQPYLHVRVEGRQEQVILWDTRDITVGRHESQDVVVPDPEVSREHARFRAQGGRRFVEDLQTALGTRVNGEPIKVHELAEGDVVQVGCMELRFDIADQPMRAVGHVRFASQLKGDMLIGASPNAPPRGDTDPSLAADASDRTMLGFEPDTDLASTPASSTAPERPVARALSLDGKLEDVGSLGSEEFEILLGRSGDVRDLDAELAAEAAGEDPNEQTMRVDGLATAQQNRLDPIPPDALRVELVIENATPKLRALLDALGGEPLDVGSLRVRFRNGDGP
jgi:predicted component of type VI protein secretion system